MKNKLSKKEAIEFLKKSKNLSSTIVSDEDDYEISENNISTPVKYKKTEDILSDIAYKIDVLNTILKDLVFDFNSLKKLS